MSRFEGRVVAIAGGAAGIGEASAGAFAADARVAILDRDSERAAALSGELGRGAEAHAGDVSSAEPLPHGR
jgi:NAD(P)-dependent dehydrogenase (short-subunit alcohol dehydrogenase family)